MCLAIPGKIIEIQNDLATVDYGDQKTLAKIVRGDFSVGDYVIVQAKLVVEKVPEQQVKAWHEIINEKPKPEVFFIKYAYPCSFIIRQRKEITDDELEELKKAAINNIALPKEKLEKIFFRAFQKIEPLAKEMNKDKWDLDVLQNYFIKNHNEIIEKGMYAYAKAPDTLKELCKVHVAKVVEVKDEFLVVEYANKKIRVVNKELVPNAKFGDNVTIHYGYAVEIVN